MTEQEQQQQDKPTADDLKLVDDRLEDDVKTDEEIFAELEAEEAAGGGGDDDGSAAADAAAAAAAEDDSDKPTDTGEEAKPDDADDDQQQQAASDDANQKDAQQQADDVWKDATTAQREAYEAATAELERLKQEDSRHRGRQSALQRQLNDLQQQVEAIRRPPADKAAGGGGSQDADRSRQADGSQDQSGFLQSEKWKGFAEEYPEVAGPVGEIIADLRATITSQGKELAAIGDDRRQDAYAEQLTVLEERHADWLTVTAEDAFGDWLNEQPRMYREAALRNAENIVDAQEAIELLDRYKAHRKDQQASGSDDQQLDDQQGAEQPGAENGQSTQQPLSERRQRQLRSSTSSRASGPGASPGGVPQDGDPAALWEAWEREEKREAAAG